MRSLSAKPDHLLAGARGLAQTPEVVAANNGNAGGPAINEMTAVNKSKQP